MSGFAPAPAAQPPTRGEIVADALRRAILLGAYRPGQRLDQATIAEQLGVSRSPVREALRTLAAEGLIETVPHKGARIPVRGADEVAELHTIRALLEGLAARRAAEVIDDATCDALGAIIDEALETEDHGRLLELNARFHAAIYAVYEQPHLLAMIQQLRNKVAPYIRGYLEIPGLKEAAWADHASILDALRARDADAAQAATKAHILRVGQDIAAHHDWTED